jgi:hypothetical protein
MAGTPNYAGAAAGIVIVIGVFHLALERGRIERLPLQLHRTQPDIGERSDAVLRPAMTAVVVQRRRKMSPSGAVGLFLGGVHFSICISANHG